MDPCDINQGTLYIFLLLIFFPPGWVLFTWMSESFGGSSKVGRSKGRGSSRRGSEGSQRWKDAGDRRWQLACVPSNATPAVFSQQDWRQKTALLEADKTKQGKKLIGGEREREKRKKGWSCQWVRIYVAEEEQRLQGFHSQIRLFPELLPSPNPWVISTLGWAAFLFSEPQLPSPRPFPIPSLLGALSQINPTRSSSSDPSPCFFFWRFLCIHSDGFAWVFPALRIWIQIFVTL